MALPGTFTDVGYSPVEGMQFDEYERAFGALRAFHKAILWALGDLLNYGEAHYGERYAQVVDATDYDIDTLTRAQRLARIFPSERRRADLSWGHHREVVDLPPSKQDILLDHAAKENLSCHALRSLRRQLLLKGMKLPEDIETLLRASQREAHVLYEQGLEDDDVAIWERDVTVLRNQRWVRATFSLKMEDVGSLMDIDASLLGSLETEPQATAPEPQHMPF